MSTQGADPSAGLPTVSVVIPTYNYGQFVTEAVQSALGQRQAPLEVIVVDDGSTDHTPEVLKPYLDRIRYIRQKNSGVSAARNTGILAARGEWVALLDADDLWHEDKLSLQMQCAVAHPEVCLIGALSAQARFPDARKTGGDLFTLFNTRDLLGSTLVTPSSAVARTECLKRAGLFNVKRRWVEDRDLWLRLSVLGPAARVNAPLWTYRPHPNQVHLNHARMREQYWTVLSEFFAAHPELRRHRAFAVAYYHYDTALTYLEAQNRVAALKHALISIARYPAPMRQRYAEINVNRLALLLKCSLPERWFRLLSGEVKALRRVLAALAPRRLARRSP